ncbi:hypothetical protein [Paenibacillus xylanexedens]|uniref:hypothetical protein n=1 Tax=Paenibacillus xylanexedens TaxID=528191 RepID=UPI00119F79CE|nr:hypothetical protein [Paenibacillus xylanexedens]
MSNIDIEKMITLAKELGIEVQENSDNPGLFLEKDGVEEKINLYDIFHFEQEYNDELVLTVEPIKVEKELKGASQSKRSFCKVDEKLFLFDSMSEVA